MLDSYLDDFPDDPLLTIRLQLNAQAGNNDAAIADHDRFIALDHPVAGEWTGVMVPGADARSGRR